jgi:hypothetical protein
VNASERESLVLALAEAIDRSTAARIALKNAGLEFEKARVAEMKADSALIRFDLQEELKGSQNA